MEALVTTLLRQPTPPTKAQLTTFYTRLFTFIRTDTTHRKCTFTALGLRYQEAISAGRLPVQKQVLQRFLHLFAHSLEGRSVDSECNLELLRLRLEACLQILITN